jgi:hypothetical protein
MDAQLLTQRLGQRPSLQRIPHSLLTTKGVDHLAAPLNLRLLRLVSRYVLRITLRQL